MSDGVNIEKDTRFDRKSCKIVAFIVFSMFVSLVVLFCIVCCFLSKLLSEFFVYFLIGGFGMFAIITVWALVFLSKCFRAYMKMNFAMRNRLDVWEKCNELLEKSTEVVNQHWCSLGVSTQAQVAIKNNVLDHKNSLNSNSIGSEQAPVSVSFGDGLTCSGGSLVNVGLPIGISRGIENSVNKSQPVIHADYKVIETMLEILADDPSHALV